MATYRQYCPVARASEILAERWTLLVVRNLLFGAATFNDIARGVPTMSRSLLVRRLGELERAGVVRSQPKADGPGSTYVLTEAGRDLADVVNELGGWAERWVEVLPEHTDPGFALWAWVHVQLERSALPQTRTVVAFTFPDQPPGNRHFWLLAEHGEAELCVRHPGGEPDLQVVAQSAAFVEWHRGRRPWAGVVRTGEVRVSGPRALVHAFPRWNTHAPA